MTRASFDALVTRLAESPTTFSERELLEPSHWSLGEDARLREDLRFRETPWGRWMLAEDLVVNDAVYRWLHAERRSSVALDAALKRAGEVFGRRCVFCADDPRFVLRHDEVHLAASELSRQPVVEDKVGDLEKYRTHLPLHSLKAAAASEPAGEWGKRAQDQVIETLGWVRVSLPGRRLNDRMFIAAIEGHSMDDGKSGLVDGGYAVFELWPSGTKQNLSVLVRGAFSDPETGNYAVKKYVADQRDAEGRHNKVSLVSLNPNKERYPNIELQPEDDDDITVVAKVVQALSTDDYERRPLTVSGAFPRRIDETPRGDALPIWRVGDPVTVTLRSTAPVAADSAKVFVLGPQGLSALALPEGQAWTLRLDDLAPGPYLLRVLAVSTGVEPEEMVFAVREGAHGRWPAARASVQLDARPLPTTPDEASPLADLRAWPQPWPLEVTAPPCWPLAGRWHTPSPLRLPRLYADEAGRFDLTTWPGALAPVLQTARGGLLTLDLGLLGRASVQHDAAVEAERVRTELCALWEPFVGLITPHAGHPGQWFEEWFRPMLSALGWIVAPTLDAVQPGVSTAKLRRARLSSSSFLLALVAPDRFDDPAVRQAVRDALRTATHDPFEEAMLSDGLRWCLYKPGRNRWHAPIAFPDAVADPVQFAHFFQDFDAG
jgi:hypothetical protein